MKGLILICISIVSEFMKMFPCLQQLDKENDAKCRPKCKEYESAAEELNSRGSTVGQNRTKEELEEIFAHSCL